MTDYGITLTQEESEKLAQMVESIHARVSQEDMTPRERFAAIAEGKSVDRLPVWVNGTGLHVPKTYGVDHGALYEDPKLALLAYMNHLDRFGGDTFSLFRFSLGDAEFGATTTMTDFGVPFTIKGYVDDYADIGNIKFPNIKKDGQLPWTLWMISQMKEQVGDIMPIWSFITTPGLTAICPGARDYQTAGIDMIRNPNMTHALAALAMKFYIQFGQAHLAAGADCINMVDAPADCSPKQFREFMYPYMCGLYHALDGKVMWATADDVTHVMEDYCKVGIKHFYLGGKIELEKALDIAGKYDVVIRWSVDPAVITHGDRESIRKEVKRVAQIGKEYGRFILGTAALDTDTPAENVDAFVEAAREFGAY